MNTIVIPALLNLAIATGDELVVNLLDQSQLKGVFIGGSTNCLVINSKGRRHIIRKDIVDHATIGATYFPSQSIFREVDTWRLNELELLSHNDTSWPPASVAISAYIHPSIPYLTLKRNTEAFHITVIDSVMIGGIAYATAIEKNWAIAIPFILTTVIIRRWAGKDSQYKLKSLRDAQNRLEQPNTTFCQD